jgi:hypothetical protein
MKKHIKYFIAIGAAVAAAGTIVACTEQIPYTNIAGKGLNSITATFATGEHKLDPDAAFIKIVDPTQEEILVEIPWFYPISSDNETTIDKMRLVANLDANSTMSPSLGGIHNLADRFHFTLTNKNGVKTDHYITGVRKKLDLKDILDFKLDSHGIDGVVDPVKRTVTLVTADEIIGATAVVSVSPHAAISPDPATPRSYESPVEFTVTAHDGTTAVYTVVKGIPNKIPLGFREGSAKLMWAKRLNADLGITTEHMTTGIAVTADHVVLNTRGTGSTYLDRKSGEKVGVIDLGSGVTGSLVNFYNTADDAGNILINNLITASGEFLVWRLSSVTGTPQPFISYNTAVPMGRKLSVKGDIDGDAIITVPVNSASSSTFARWRVTGGTLESQTPEMVTISGFSWSNNFVDIVHSSPTSLTDDYFAAGYSTNTTAWIDGSNNTVRAKLTQTSSNWIPNAIDHAVFNGNTYILYNAINSFTWGASDQICLAEAVAPAVFTSPSVDGNGNTALGQAVKWISPVATYGGNQGSGVNSNGTGDVELVVSPDGYYMYVYFMFTNGYVVCYRFDCIEQ